VPGCTLVSQRYPFGVATKNGKRNVIPYCGVDKLLRLIQGRWKTSLLRQLSHGSMRHGELRRRLHGITQKMLTQRLRELERDGLIRRTALMEGNVRVVEYSSTSWGRDVMNIVMQIHHWSLSHRGKLRGTSRDRRQPTCEPLENGR
jgi:DNA-binding HxlR family transcriptional regulator